jgi:membrane dipeptidase
MLDVMFRRLRGERMVLRRVHVPRLRSGGVNIQVLVVGGDVQMFSGDALVSETVQALRVIEALWEEVDESDREARIVKSGREVFADNESIGLLLHLEGGRPFAGSLELVRLFVRLGVRSVGLTWNHANELADGCLEPRGGGLTSFGRKVVEALASLGVVIDVSHASDRAVWDVLELGTGAIIASHSNARALCDHPRNLPDELLRAIAQTGGTVGVAFYPPLVSSTERQPLVRDVVEQIIYLCEVCGEEHVAIGPDFIDMADESWYRSAVHADISADLVRPYPRGLENVTQLPAMREALRSAGVGEDTIGRVMGANLSRVLRGVLGDAT